MNGQTAFDDGSHEIIAACIEVHRHLGPGLLESLYEECLAIELEMRGIRVDRQRVVPIHYKERPLEASYRLDLVVKEQIVVEVKAVERLLPVHEAQLLSYLRLTKLRTGLLVNFHVPALRRGGIRRLTWRAP